MTSGKLLSKGSALVFVLLAYSFLHSSVFSQNYVLKNDIPVVVGGQTLRAAWAGGFNSPQFNECDLDNDGTLDLIVFDRYDSTLTPLINGGAAGQIDYDYAPEYIANFPQGLQGWMLMRDYDGDGLMDIFTGVPGISNVRVFRNTSAQTGNNLSFALAEDTIISTYPPVLALYVAKTDIPAIDDIDGDGDLDIVTFHVGGSYVEYHQNQSMEIYGDRDHLEFEIASHCFGHFEEDANDCTAYIEMIPCAPGERIDPSAHIQKPLDGGAHAGSTMLSIDMNEDGVKELIVGDVGCRTFYALANSGTQQIAHFNFVEEDFPTQDVSVDVSFFPAPFYLDVDNDGVKDLVSAPNAKTEVEDIIGTMLHKNNGADNNPTFNFQGYGFIQDEMIESGTGSAPAFFDYNADGLTDLLVANRGRYDSISSFTTYLQLYENIGTLQEPAFELVDNDYLGLRNHPDFQNANWLIPTFGDLDGDNDLDLLLGEEDGGLFHFDNTAGSGNVVAFTLASTLYEGIDVGLNSSPELYDLDSDQDLDLLIGTHRGYISYYENVGNKFNASFTLVTDTFGMVKVNDFSNDNVSNGQARPRILDYDNDTDLELLVGGLEGEVQVYENFSLTPGATFTRSNDLFGLDYGYFASVAATELDSSRLSYVVGGYRGGLMLVRDGGPVSADQPIEAFVGELLLYPNPVQDLLHLRLETSSSVAGYGYRILNPLGQQLQSGSLLAGAAEISTQGLPSGVYFAVVTGKSGSVSKRFVVAR